jgi:hypothetical protein
MRIYSKPKAIMIFSANIEKRNLIGWRQTLSTSPANHILLFFLVRAKKIAKWKTDFTLSRTRRTGRPRLACTF